MHIFLMARKRGPRKGSRFDENHSYAFGKKLHDLRKRKGLTQAQLAERLGITTLTVSYYERRAKNPTMALIEKLAEALEVKKGALLEEREGPGRQGEVEMPQVIKALRQRLPKLAALTRKDQESLVAVIDGLLAK